MKPEEWAEKAAQYNAMVGATAGKAFVALDGKFTAVVPALPDQDVLLMLVGHELLESTGQRLAAAEGYVWPGATMAGLAHLVRGEYVVERTRRGIADRLGWGRSAIEDASLAATARDIAAELPELLRWAVAHDDVPQRLHQHWGELILAWGGEQGRSDAGDAGARADLDAFYDDAIIVPAAGLWRTVGTVLNELYGHPHRTIAQLDDAVAAPLRNLYWDGLAAFWNPLYDRGRRGVT